jgi:hypothetical protein
MDGFMPLSFDRRCGKPATALLDLRVAGAARRPRSLTAACFTGAIYYEVGGLYQQRQIAFAGLIAVIIAAFLLVFVLLLYLDGASPPTILSAKA